MRISLMKIILNLVISLIVTGCLHEGTEVSINKVGSVNGVVTDGETNEPISGVTVQIANKTDTTNSAGVYLIDSVTVGSVVLTASAEGYQPHLATVTVIQSQQVEHSFTLQTGDALDAVPPVVTVPENINITTINPAGESRDHADIAEFLSAATATDDVDGIIVEVTNDAPLVFPVGETLVTFSARDEAGNVGVNTASVSVILINNFPPVFESLSSVSVGENSVSTGYIALASDADGDSISYRISGGEDGDKFLIDAETGVLNFKSPPNYEVPSDNNRDNNYLVEVTASDGGRSSSQLVSIAVTDSNDAPIMTGEENIVVAENVIQIGYVALATDEDGDSIKYSIAGGVDQGDFVIDGDSGSLDFKLIPDYENPVDEDSNNEYIVVINASDGATSSSKEVTVRVKNENDNTPLLNGIPVIILEENKTDTGFSVSATDADGDDISYSIAGGQDESVFSIDSGTGALSFRTTPNYESPIDGNMDNVYMVEISASDGLFSDTEIVSVTIVDANDSPVFDDQVTVTINENSTETGYSATATDEDGDPISYSISGGDDGSKFIIDSSTGKLSFNIPPDYEVPTDRDSDNEYKVEISASDGSLSGYVVITVRVLNLNDNIPLFTSTDNVNVDENSVSTGLSVTASDDDGDQIVYSISGGEDELIFSIDGDTGSLTFKSPVDYESPGDAGTDNEYKVEVTASDGKHEVVQTVIVDVINVNDNSPVITSGSVVNVPENTTLIGYSVAAEDDDGDAVSFSISGGEDQDRFILDASSGSLRFVSAQDCEGPLDANSDNSYEIEIMASDGVNASTQSISVSVYDVLELNASSGGIKTIQFDWSDFDGAAYYRLLINPDGASGYAIVQDNISTNTAMVKLPVHLTDWVNATYMLEAYDANGLLDSSGPVNISALMLSTIGYIKSSNTSSEQRFGGGLSVSGDGSTLVVGAIYDASGAKGINGDQNDTSAPYSGAVYVYSKHNGQWVQEAYLKASNTDENDNFGGVVSISNDGNTLAVGALNEDSAATGVNGSELSNAASDSGAVYIFSRTGGEWSQQAYIKPSNAEAGDRFGFVSISGDGNTLAVGAQQEDSGAIGINGDENDNSAISSGAVYIFNRDGSTWKQEAYIKASNTGANDGFFRPALSSDGARLVVSARFEDSIATDINGDQLDNNDTNSGAVYVFSRIGTSWLQEAYIKAPTQVVEFGYAVSLSGDGNTLAASSGVGGLKENANVYVFQRDNGAWQLNGEINSVSSQPFVSFGYSITQNYDGNILVITDPEDDGDGVGVREVIGSTKAGSGGAAYAYRYMNGRWGLLSYIRALNPDGGDRFGSAMSMSDDGSLLAISAPHEDSDSTGINSDWGNNRANESGAVYLY